MVFILYVRVLLKDKTLFWLFWLLQLLFFQSNWYFESLFPSHMQCLSSSSHIIQFMGMSYEFLFPTNFLFLKNNVSFFLIIKITHAQGQKWENTKDIMEKRFKKRVIFSDSQSWLMLLCILPSLVSHWLFNLYCQGKAIDFQNC